MLGKLGVGLEAGDYCFSKLSQTVFDRRSWTSSGRLLSPLYSGKRMAAELQAIIRFMGVPENLALQTAIPEGPST
jgi:hypothetical protein